MTRLEKLEKDLLEIVQRKMPVNDPSHDVEHVKRVLAAVKLIQSKEGGDLEILIPAALFHDVITYQKTDVRNKQATDESAQYACEILKNYAGYSYPNEKILAVMSCVLECSWSKGLSATSLESKILQDADRLEAVGALAIMRTFTSGGQMNRPLYNPKDPFCEKGIPTGVSASLDLFYQRLLKVYPTLHSKTAQKIAHRRVLILNFFLLEVKQELDELGLLP